MNGLSRKRSIWTLVGGVGMGIGAAMFLFSIIDSGYGLVAHGVVVFILGVLAFLAGRAQEKASRKQ